MAGPLDGIRVLDMSRVLAGPWAGQLLGDYGADVVKLERPDRGDETRAWGPPWLSNAGKHESAYFLSTNRNKRSITVDFSSDDGRVLAAELASEADILIENYKSGTLDRYGLGAKTLTSQNPKLIYCSISAFAQDSSKAREPGYDAMIQASAGLMSITGAADTEGGGPQKVGVAIADIMAGMYAATAILAALAKRGRSGKGQFIEVPLYDSQVAWLANQNMNYLIGGTAPRRRGTAHPNIVPYQVFPTRDGYLMLAVGNDRQFAACAQCLDVPELAKDIRFAGNADRLQHREELIALLSEAFRARDSAEWLKRLSDCSVPCGPINDIEQVFESDYANERALVRQLKHPYDDAMPTVANPSRFSATPVSYRKAPPLLGQHTAEILADWLGYSAEKVAHLKSVGAV